MKTSSTPQIAGALLPLLFMLPWLGGCSTLGTGGSAIPLDAKRTEVLRSVAAINARSFPVVAARITLGIQADLAWQQLDSLVGEPTGDMFWMYPATAFYFHCKNKLDTRWRNRFREAWKTYTPYRGDTENHFLMYYSSILLAAQEWPDLPGSEWFNGKSSRENYDEAYEYLNHWIEETALHGCSEWDSPRYAYYYITPLLTLHDFTADPLLRRRAGMMLEYMLADFAAEYLNGSYCGAHSRDGDNSVINPRNSEAYSYAGFYFEEKPEIILPDLAFAAMSSFAMPDIIRDIAHDRSQSYVHTEIQRSRAKIRNSKERFTPVYKYTYMTPEYCLGSMQGGLQQPIQQHTWDVTFASPKANNTIFGLHPEHSASELAMFFPEEPELMVDGVARVKGSYTSEDKWVGGSAFERVFQHRGTLIALYDLTPRSQVRHTDLFFPKTLDTLERDTSGWIFCRMGNAFTAVYPSYQKYEWIEEADNWRLRAKRMRTGYVVECSAAHEMSYQEFKDRCRRSTLPEALISRSEGNFLKPGSNIHGDLLSVESNRHGGSMLLVNGTSLAPDTTWRFNGPHLRSRAGSGVIEMRYGAHSRTLDFTQNDIIVK